MGHGSGRLEVKTTLLHEEHNSASGYSGGVVVAQPWLPTAVQYVGVLQQAVFEGHRLPPQLVGITHWSAGRNRISASW